MCFLDQLKEKDILSLKSDFITANLEGQIDVPNIFNSLLDYLNPHFPLFSGSSNYIQDFEFDLNFLDTSALTELLKGVVQLKMLLKGQGY